MALPATEASSVLFREAHVSENRPSRATPGVIRARMIEASPHDLAVTDVPVGLRVERRLDITLNLFDDAWFPVRLEAAERDRIGSTVWYGRVTGQPRSSVTLTVNEGSMSVSLSSGSQRYVVRPARNGLHEAVQLDSAGFPRELEPVPAFVGAAVAGDGIASDDGSTWDILVAYTHIVRNFYGSAAAVEALISDAIASTNTAYLNSGVNSRVRLVGVIETTYDDQTTDFSTTLGRLRNGGDGFMDAVVTQRETVGADAVALLVYNPTNNACGIGYLMTSPGAGFAANAFSVTRDDCAVGNFSFAHELGHNFGLEHDRVNSGGVASYPYAFGYQDTTSLFRDIMAYNCPANCPRIQYFSNPDVMYNGRPLGVLYTDPLAADNRRALNNSATYIGNWRQTVIPLISFTDDPLIAGTTVVKAVHITELRTAINARRVSAGLSATTWTNTIVAGGTIRAADIEEMRSALTPALGSPPTYTDAALSGVTVQAIHIQELRNLTR
jgi:peptidyl-Asp metalloendopeptidase